jgi:hypothetical protein
MTISIDGLQPQVGGSINEWGLKLNNIDNILADGINEMYEMLYMITGMDGGKANSVYTPIQKVNGGGA